MSARRLLFVGMPLTALAALTVLALPAAAHEHYPAAPYELIVGWRDEPAVVDEMNGLALGVMIPGNGTDTPVEGVQGDLAVTLIFGTSSKVMALEPQFEQPGWYTFDFIPTKEGAYSVRIVGTLNGTAINITAPLEDAQDREALGFPGPAPSAPELDLAIEGLAGGATTLSARIGALESNSSGGALAAQVASLQADNQALKSAAAMAELLAVVGILAGVAGVALSVRGRKGPPKSGSA